MDTQLEAQAVARAVSHAVFYAQLPVSALPACTSGHFLLWCCCRMFLQLSRVLLQRYDHFDAVFSSDLLRTVQTAQVLAAPYQAQVRHERQQETTASESP